MSDIFDEVEDSLRTERSTELWSKYWPIIAAVAVLVVGGVGFNSWQNSQRDQAREVSGAAFDKGVQAIEIEDLELTRRHFADASEKDTGFRDLASHFLAGAELSLAGDAPKAVEHLEQTGTQEGPLAKLSLIKAAYLKAGQTDLATLEADLAPLVDAGGPFGALANEIIAAKAFEEGDKLRAREIYKTLSLGLDTPEGVQQRAAMALTVLPASLLDQEQEAPQSDEAPPADDDLPATDEPSDNTDQN